PRTWVMVFPSLIGRSPARCARASSLQYQHTLMGRDGLLTVFIVVVTLGGPAALRDQSKPAPAALEGPWRSAGAVFASCTAWALAFGAVVQPMMRYGIGGIRGRSTASPETAQQQGWRASGCGQRRVLLSAKLLTYRPELASGN